jgi:2-amino-4-hydroxy-6-hydroxymethyldihydropteridine diphosphokinase
MGIALLSIGSNVGDRMKNLKKAMSLLSVHPDISVLDVSSVYETDPVEYLEQDDFLNLVCRVETDLTPLELLHYAQTIEQILFRERTIRFGPRTMDIDILTYDEQVISSDELTLPHPRMSERAFVQIPLREILHASHALDDSDSTVRRFGIIPENCWLKHT